MLFTGQLLCDSPRLSLSGGVALGKSGGLFPPLQSEKHCILMHFGLQKNIEREEVG